MSSSPVAAINTPATPPAAAPAAAVAPRAERPEAARVDEEAGVRAALGRYRDAYEQLDASAAKQVWPGVDERALSKAFANLEAQTITFDECKTVVASPTAMAFCRGTTTYVGRFGNRNSQTQTRQWTFHLRKDGNAWDVENVQVR